MIQARGNDYVTTGSGPSPVRKTWSHCKTLSLCILRTKMTRHLPLSFWGH